MSVEILTVSLDDSTIETLANRIAYILNGNGSATNSNPPSTQNPQNADRSTSPQPADPWQNSNNGGQQNNGNYQGNQYQNQGPGQNQNGQQQQGHNCAHGPMTFVPAGVNRNTNEPYNAYYKCPLQRGAQGRCRNAYI